MSEDSLAALAKLAAAPDGHHVRESELHACEAILVYFAAPGAAASIQFERSLASVVETVGQKGGRVAVFWVPVDATSESYAEHRKRLWWSAVPFECLPDAHDHLRKLLDVSGCPALVVLGPDGQKRRTCGSAMTLKADEYPWESTQQLEPTPIQMGAIVALLATWAVMGAALV
eukprot:m.263858 g.263858  ORF g.263858 m.263858 type:complete len:173 (+) comp27298_c0_seq1:3-521(+)